MEMSQSAARSASLKMMSTISHKIELLNFGQNLIQGTIVSRPSQSIQSPYVADIFIGKHLIASNRHDTVLSNSVISPSKAKKNEKDDFKRISEELRQLSTSPLTTPNEILHLAHTPALDCAGMINPGSIVYLNKSKSDSSKTKYSVQCVDELREKNVYVKVGCNPSSAEKLALAMLKSGLLSADITANSNSANGSGNNSSTDTDINQNIPRYVPSTIELDLENIMSQKTYGNSRVDYVIPSIDKKVLYLVEVKGVVGADYTENQVPAGRSLTGVYYSRSNSNSRSNNNQSRNDCASDVEDTKNSNSSNNDKYHSPQKEQQLKQQQHKVIRNAIFPHGSHKPIGVVSDRAIKHVHELTQLQGSTMMIPATDMMITSNKAITPNKKRKKKIDKVDDGDDKNTANQSSLSSSCSSSASGSSTPVLIQSVILFVVNRGDCDAMRPCHEADMLFSQVLKRAYHKGVKVLAYDVVYEEVEEEIINNNCNIKIGDHSSDDNNRSSSSRSKTNKKPTTNAATTTATTPSRSQDGLTGRVHFGKKLPVLFDASVDETAIDEDHLMRVLTYNAEFGNARSYNSKSTTSPMKNNNNDDDIDEAVVVADIITAETSCNNDDDEKISEQKRRNLLPHHHHCHQQAASVTDKVIIITSTKSVKKKATNTTKTAATKETKVKTTTAAILSSDDKLEIVVDSNKKKTKLQKIK